MPVRVPGHFWLPKVQQSDFRGGRNKRVCKRKSICCHVLISLWILQKHWILDSYQSCLVDAANAIDGHDDDDLEAFRNQKKRLHPSMWIMFALFFQWRASLLMENVFVQFVKRRSTHGVVTMKTLQALQISFAIYVFQINTNKDIELKRSITRELNVNHMVR